MANKFNYEDWSGHFEISVPQYVPVVNPNGVQGWYPAVMRAPAQGPIIRTTDEIRYPSIVTQQQATTTATTDPVAALEKQQVVKTQATRNGE